VLVATDVRRSKSLCLGGRIALRSSSCRSPQVSANVVPLAQRSVRMLGEKAHVHFAGAPNFLSQSMGKVWNLTLTCWYSWWRRGESNPCTGANTSVISMPYKTRLQLVPSQCLSRADY
jgi:hypothetical protein